MPNAPFRDFAFNAMRPVRVPPNSRAHSPCDPQRNPPRALHSRGYRTPKGRIRQTRRAAIVQSYALKLPSTHTAPISRNLTPKSPCLKRRNDPYQAVYARHTPTLETANTLLSAHFVMARIPHPSNRPVGLNLVDVTSINPHSCRGLRRGRLDDRRLRLNNDRLQHHDRLGLHDHGRRSRSHRSDGASCCGGRPSSRPGAP